MKRKHNQASSADVPSKQQKFIESVTSGHIKSDNAKSTYLGLKYFKERIDSLKYQDVPINETSPENYSQEYLISIVPLIINKPPSKWSDVLIVLIQSLELYDPGWMDVLVDNIISSPHRDKWSKCIRHFHVDFESELRCIGPNKEILNKLYPRRAQFLPYPWKLQVSYAEWERISSPFKDISVGAFTDKDAVDALIVLMREDAFIDSLHPKLYSVFVHAAENLWKHGIGVKLFRELIEYGRRMFKIDLLNKIKCHEYGEQPLLDKTLKDSKWLCDATIYTLK